MSTPFMVAVSMHHINSSGLQYGITEKILEDRFKRGDLYFLRPIDELCSVLASFQCRLGPDIHNVTNVLGDRYSWQQPIIHRDHVPVGVVTLISEIHPEYDEGLEPIKPFREYLER